MKKKIFTGIITSVLAVSVVFAGCTDVSGGVQYTVTFDAGSGTVTPESAKVKKGGKVSQPSATYTGHHVEGWYEESGYTNEWVFSENTVQSDITLYAKWEANSYNVELDVNGGAALQNSTVSVTYGETFNLGSTTRSGYNFDGWTYNDTLITDRNGKGKSAWSIADNVTLVAKWSVDQVTGDTDVSGLESAIEAMGYNYTAEVWNNSNTTPDYAKISTEKGIYKKAPSEYASSGILFDTSGYYVYEFKVRGGNTIINYDNPSKKDDDTYYTRQDIYESEYIASVINPQAYLSQGSGVYACRAEYREQQGSAILGKAGSAASIYITVSGDYISRIAIDDFLDKDIGKEDTIEIEFSKIGTSSIDEYINTSGNVGGSYELPGPTDPSKPVAPSSVPGSDEVKPVDSVPSSAYVNGSNDNALPALKAAIDSARQKIRYNFEDYFEDTVNKNTQYWQPSSNYYISQFDGYKAYVANAYASSGIYFPTTENYIVLSGGKVYRIDDENGIIKYVERDSSYEDRTLGGNIFFKLNASMFEQSAVNPNAFTVKSQYLDAACEVLFDCARGANKFYNGTPTIRNASVTVTLTNDGKFQSIEANRLFVFGSGTPDLQQMKFSFDYYTQLVMPYEVDIKYTADEQVLYDAIVNTGNNYTLDYQYYDGWQIIEYYADNGIWKWIKESLWGSSGFVYINDYAYFFDFDTENNNALIVDDEPWDGGTYPKETNGKYYRAWMNVYYLPLVQIDPRDFTRTGERVYECKSSVLLKYEDVFFDFRDEGGLDGLKIYLDDQGRIEKLECYNWYMGNEAAYASVIYVGDIGTTEIMFLF